MLKAKKDNKLYCIEEINKKQYLADGYDIYDEEGNVLEYSPLKTIKYQDHLDILKKLGKSGTPEEVEELKKQLQEKEEEVLKLQNDVPGSVMELLKSYANSKGIDIGSASSESGVLNKITEAEKE